MTSATGHVVIITPALDDNSLGRTYCIWLLCQAAGWRTTVLSPAPTAQLWAPLRDTGFEADCRSLPISIPGNAAHLNRWLDDAVLIIVIKPIPESFGLVTALLRRRTNVIVDVDDPDIEAQTKWLPTNARVGALKTRRYWDLQRCRLLVRRFPVMVSNPLLQPMYGGVLVPHVRADTGAGNEHVTTEPRIAFVGTAKTHKGIEVLREAVRPLAASGWTLDITAPAPGDALAHESWHGHTSLECGLWLTREADIIAIPSLAGGYSQAQFPVKLVDAQIAARAIVASDVGPMSWALGAGGVLVPAGDAIALRAALSSLRDPAVRTEMGRLARSNALSRYTLEAVLPAFLDAVTPLLRQSVGR